MRVEVNDNATGVIIAICVVIALFNFGQCSLAEHKTWVEEQKLHLDAGQCKDKWGTWSKCQ